MQMKEGSSSRGNVACLAGRRIDSDVAEPSRFPSHNAPAVKASLIEIFKHEMVEHLVCSAACGADILALEACEELGIDATIILPFVKQEFRRLSVTDRSGDWGTRFDHLIESNRAHGTLVELGLPTDTANAFEQANIEIVQRASQISANEHLAVIVWDGAKQGASDATKDVRDRALAVGFRVIEISTVLPT